MRLENAPLALVLTQVRFTADLEMESRIAPLQPLLRDLGFVRFDRGVLAEISIGGQSQEIRTSPRWDFGDKDRQWLVSIAQEFVTISTTAYRGFAGFASRTEAALTAVFTLSHPPILDRVGLRYVDIVRPAGTAPIEEWLHPGLCGFPISDTGPLARTREGLLTQTVAKTALGRLLVKSMTLGDKQRLPPDLEQLGITVLPALTEGSGRIAVDFDHIAEPNTDFSVETSMNTIRSLHIGLREAFQVATTAAARATWGPEVPE